MLIGLDLDNTIVCYDQLFRTEAERRGLIAGNSDYSKAQIRDALRKAKREDEWTLLQGYVYGPGMQGAEFFPGFEQFLEKCHKAHVTLAIVSHRSLYPYMGEKYNLHQSARDWLKARGVFHKYSQAINPEQIYFETEKLAKLKRIATLGCDFFVDDLPEILADQHFPNNVTGILFDPHAHFVATPSFARVGSWQEVGEVVVPV